jgi:hypothetical protein
MKEENLIKKLEGITLPSIEIKSHKERLNLALMKKYFPEKKKAEVFNIFGKIVPAGALAVILSFFIFNNLISPRYNLAKAKEIALQNNEIKGWINEGATIKDVKIIDGQAYVLIEPKETPKEDRAIIYGPKSAETPAENLEKKEGFGGALIGIDIKKKKVSKIEKLIPTVTGLMEEKKEKAAEIAEKSSEIKKTIPEGAEVLDINVSAPKFKLEKKGNSIFVLPESESEEKASIIYKSDGERWEGKINLTEEKVEEIESFGGNKE